MNAECFYVLSNKNACKLKLLSEESWKNNVLPDKEVARARSLAFSAKIGQIIYFHDDTHKLVQVWVGAGKNEFDTALATAATKCPEGTYFLEQTVTEQSLVKWALAQYQFTKYKKNIENPRRLCLDKETRHNVIIAADVIFWVRDLINTPAQDMGPLDLANAATDLTKMFNAQSKVIVGDDLLSENYPAIHAVGRASNMPPCLIEVSWGKEHNPLISIVGKGVCFDSGGLNLKDAKSMRLMKKDMGGAAHALGLARWIMALNLPFRLKVYVAAAENAIGANAYRPGDVITMRNKLTVEIENTDAEGRVVMADALVKACEEKPELLIDFATLTGAARVAVGADIAAFFTNDDKVSNHLLYSSEVTMDPLWRLPLFQGYKTMLSSSIADLTNASTSSYAGAITAALFLQRFIADDIRWVHFDMMAWNLSNRAGKPEGGEAMALTAIIHYLQNANGF